MPSSPNSGTGTAKFIEFHEEQVIIQVGLRSGEAGGDDIPGGSQAQVEKLVIHIAQVQVHDAIDAKRGIQNAIGIKPCQQEGKPGQVVADMARCNDLPVRLNLDGGKFIFFKGYRNYSQSIVAKRSIQDAIGGEPDQLQAHSCILHS